MPILGNTATPNWGWQAYGLNVQNTAWQGFTMPAGGGLITSVSGYFDAGTSTAGNGYVFVFAGGTGALLASASVGSVPPGSHSTGGQAWHTGTLATPLFVAGGASILLGFWMPQASGMVFSWFNGSGAGIDTEPGSAPTGASGSQTGFGGVIGVYATYTLAGVKVRRGGGWAPVTLKVRRAGAWVTPAVYVRRAGAWVQLQ